ncbi:MAG: flippase-like domain-containing protein, partial [Chloroflexi bacterium]|nr:flippase-like domain-containing protein [Chloroflexota bacterium]
MNLQSPFTNSQLRRALGYALSLIILFFLARVLAQTWNDFAATNFRFTFDGARVIVSLVLLVLARVFAVEAWRRIIIALGDALPFTFAMRVWFVSNLARYVPGNIWQVAAMMTMVNAKGVSKTNALLSQIIYTAIALSISGLLGIFFVVFQPQVLQGLVPISPSPLNNYLPALAASAFSALIVGLALPQMFRLIIRVAAKISRRDLTAPPTTFARGLVPPLYSSAMWLTNGVAFFLFVSAITDLSLAQLPALIAINAGAYWIGYLSFITPSGLGFREGALAFMLAVYFPTPIAVALSLL